MCFISTHLTFPDHFCAQIDGTFRINTPPFLLGYTYDMLQAQPGASDVETTIGRGSSYLSMFVTIEPSLSLPEPFKEKVTFNMLCKMSLSIRAMNILLQKSPHKAILKYFFLLNPAGALSLRLNSFLL